MGGIVILAFCEYHFIREHGNLVQHQSNNISIIRSPCYCINTTSCWPKLWMTRNTSMRRSGATQIKWIISGRINLFRWRIVYSFRNFDFFIFIEFINFNTIHTSSMTVLFVPLLIFFRYTSRLLEVGEEG